MKFSEIIIESKDVKGFQSEFTKLTISDSKFRNLLMNYKKDQDKIVDLIDYSITTYKKELETMMKKYSLNYDDTIEAILGVK